LVGVVFCIILLEEKYKRMTSDDWAHSKDGKALKYDISNIQFEGTFQKLHICIFRGGFTRSLAMP